MKQLFDGLSVRNLVRKLPKGLGLWPLLQDLSEGVLPEDFRKNPYSQFFKVKYENGKKIEYFAEPDDTICNELKIKSLKALENIALPTQAAVLFDAPGNLNQDKH